MTGAARACTRLLRGVLHLLRGLATIGFVFPRATPARRQELIGAWSGRLVHLLGVQIACHGKPLQGGGLMTVNHVSWLDFAVVQAVCPQARFVAKSNIRHWPLLGWLAAGAGTLFIERERKRDALRVVHHMAEALQQHGTIAIFPEGTTGPGDVLLPFHTNLLQAVLVVHAPVQPVSLRYADPHYRYSPVVQYLDDTTLIGSLWRIARAEGVRVHVCFGALLVGGSADRRALGTQVKAALAEQLAGGD